MNDSQAISAMLDQILSSFFVSREENTSHGWIHFIRDSMVTNIEGLMTPARTNFIELLSATADGQPRNFTVEGRCNHKNSEASVLVYDTDGERSDEDNPVLWMTFKVSNGFQS